MAQTVKNYKDRKGELAALLTEVSDFLERFSVRERLDISSTWNHGLYTRIFVNVLNVFGLVTKIVKGKRKCRCTLPMAWPFVNNRV